MRALLPRLYALTDRRLAGGARHDQVVEALLRGGVRLIQLREKLQTPAAFFSEALPAVALAKAAGALIVVNDRPDIAFAARADGVHLGRDDLPAEEARRFLGPRMLVGVSTHSVEEGVEASELPVDYVAIGPVFPTRAKADAEPVVGIDAVRRLAAAVSLPVVAIGGIHADNVRSVLDAGASSVAVITALYEGRSIEENVAELLKRL